MKNTQQSLANEPEVSSSSTTGKTNCVTSTSATPVACSSRLTIEFLETEIALLNTKIDMLERYTPKQADYYLNLRRDLKLELAALLDA